jgi:hypothetical protein
MTVKEYVTNMVRKMPDDVTIEEIVRWVTVLDMLGFGKPGQEELCRNLSAELEKDFEEYFKKSVGERKRPSLKKARKKRAVGAA